MAEEQKEQDQKTEEATPHRIQEAFKKGQVALSKEVTHWFALTALALTILIFLPFSFHIINEFMVFFFLAPHQITLDSQTSQTLMNSIFIKVIICFIPLASLLIIATLGAGFLQTRLAIQFDALMPKFERISPMAGMKRLFSKRSLVDFIKNLLKLGVVAVCLFTFFKFQTPQLPGWADMEPIFYLPTVQKLALKCLMIIICLLTVIAVLDYVYQKYEFLKNLRMTKEEVKQEHKDTEGDPMIKHRQRQLGRQLIKQNLAVEVPQATVVITNPTHYAVALRYEQDTMEAPVVVAKGVELLALRIREIANAHRIPIVENPPLARALYKGVDVTHQIPQEHYKAVAEVINYIMSLKKTPWQP